MRRFGSLVDALCIWLATASWGIHTLIDDILSGVIIPKCLCLKKPVLNDLYFSRDDIKRYIRTNLAGHSIAPIRLAEGTTERLIGAIEWSASLVRMYRLISSREK